MATGVVVAGALSLAGITDAWEGLIAGACSLLYLGYLVAVVRMGRDLGETPS